MVAIQGNAERARKGKQTTTTSLPGQVGRCMSAQAVGLTRKRQRKRRSTSVPLVPPNPKEFESATSMSISRAWLAQ